MARRNDGLGVIATVESLEDEKLEQYFEQRKKWPRISPILVNSGPSRSFRTQTGTQLAVPTNAHTKFPGGRWNLIPEPSPPISQPKHMRASKLSRCRACRRFWMRVRHNSLHQIHRFHGRAT